MGSATVAGTSSGRWVDAAGRRSSVCAARTASPVACPCGRLVASPRRRALNIHRLISRNQRRGSGRLAPSFAAGGAATAGGSGIASTPALVKRRTTSGMAVGTSPGSIAAGRLAGGATIGRAVGATAAAAVALGPGPATSAGPSPELQAGVGRLIDVPGVLRGVTPCRPSVLVVVSDGPGFSGSGRCLARRRSTRARGTATGPVRLGLRSTSSLVGPATGAGFPIGRLVGTDDR